MATRLRSRRLGKRRSSNVLCRFVAADGCSCVCAHTHTHTLANLYRKCHECTYTFSYDVSCWHAYVHKPSCLSTCHRTRVAIAQVRWRACLMWLWRGVEKNAHTHTYRDMGLYAYARIHCAYAHRPISTHTHTYTYARLQCAYTHMHICARAHT